MVTHAFQQRKRGPKTPAGKDAASRNALKHGLRAEKHVLLDGEDPAEFEALKQAICDEFQSEGQFETRLAGAIALCLLRMERIAAVEAAVMNYTANDAFAIGPELYTERQRTQRALIATINNHWLQNCDRYQTANERHLRRAVQELRAHQAARRTNLPLSPDSYHVMIPASALSDGPEALPPLVGREPDTATIPA